MACRVQVKVYDATGRRIYRAEIETHELIVEKFAVDETAWRCRQLALSLTATKTFKEDQGGECTTIDVSE